MLAIYRTPAAFYSASLLMHVSSGFATYSCASEQVTLNISLLLRLVPA